MHVLGFSRDQPPPVLTGRVRRKKKQTRILESLWDVADELSNSGLDVDRAGKPSRVLAWVCLSFACAFVSLMFVFLTLLLGDPRNRVYPALTYGPEVLAMVCLALFLHFGTREQTRWTYAVSRAVLWLLRWGAVGASGAVSVLAAMGLYVAIHANVPNAYLLAACIQLGAIVLAFLGLRMSPAIIATRTKADPFHFRNVALVVWLLACIGAGAVASSWAHSASPTSVATVAVALTFASLVIGSYAQLRKATRERRHDLVAALTSLYVELDAVEIDRRKLLEAALQVESTILQQEQSAGFLPASRPLSDPVRDTLFCALTVVARVPLREVTTRRSEFVGGYLNTTNPNEALKVFVWRLRAIVLRSARRVSVQSSDKFAEPVAHACDSESGPAAQPYRGVVEDLKGETSSPTG